ncbi:MAG: hypothetical protein KDA41_22435, partial [Planctomycetales bacterium]|nr:hypothetical protein [Planctomycetales bacterium]
HRVGAMLSLVEPQIPDDWFDEILRSPSHDALARYARHLPDDVRQAAAQHQAAQIKLQKLNGRS